MTRTTAPAWHIAVESALAAAVAYVLAGMAELSLIRVFQPSELELAWVSDVMLAVAFGVAVYLWRHLSATRSALLERERAELVLTTQLSLAADLQRRLLPTLPAADGRVEWAAALKPAGQIGGDFYDLVTFPDRRQMLLVADVSGKGIPAAMALSTLRAAFRAYATPEATPADVLTRISTALHGQWGGSPYLTGLVALIDPADGVLRYANAAHPAGVVVGPAGTRTLEPLGPPAALLPGVVYHERSIGLGAGDLCVFVSDGITEAMGDDAAGRIEDLMRTEEAAPGAVHDVCAAVMAAGLSGSGPEGVADWHDDRTVVVLAVLDDGYEPASAPGPAVAAASAP